MAASPTVDDVQDAVMQAWTAVCNPASPTPSVLDTLVFFDPQNGLTAIAIVDVHGENTYRCGTQSVRTIHHETPFARQAAECRVGECISQNANRLLLVARDGGPLADLEICRLVMSAEAEIALRSARLASVLDNLSSTLSRRIHGLERDIHVLDVASNSVKAAATAGVCRDALIELELRLAHLRVQHTVRSLAHLDECMEAEADAAHELHCDVLAEIAKIEEAMEPYHAELVSKETRIPYPTQTDRHGAEEAYIDALKNPRVISVQNAVANLDMIRSLNRQGTLDNFSIRRKLYTLKCNVTHTAAQPGSDRRWATILTEIAVEIDNLRTLIMPATATHFETVCKTVSATAENPT